MTDTVERFNEYAARGVDPDFSRGKQCVRSFPPRWADERSRFPPHATLGPIRTGPFYAVEVVSSALGTKGGPPRTDVEGRVLDVDGSVIAGLYAAGNVMANPPSGMVYGGAGATLAVAGIWGMRAGRAAVADHRPMPETAVVAQAKNE